MCARDDPAKIAMGADHLAIGFLEPSFGVRFGHHERQVQQLPARHLEPAALGGVERRGDR